MKEFEFQIMRFGKTLARPTVVVHASNLEEAREKAKTWLNGGECLAGEIEKLEGAWTHMRLINARRPESADDKAEA